MRTATILSASLIALAVSAAVHAGTFERSVAADARGIVDISNVSGKVEVTGWDQPQVAVHAEYGSGVERVDVTTEQGRTIIKVIRPEGAHWGHNADAELRVQIPKDSELDVSAVSADVRSTGVDGVQRLNAVSGDIEAQLGSADFDAKTVSGDIKLEGHGAQARLHLSSVSGDVTLKRGGGDIEAGTVSGELKLDADSVSGVRARTTSGDLHFSGKLANDGKFDASTVSGDLDVKARSDGGYSYEITTFSGDITNCFNAPVEKKSLPGHTLQGSRGTGSGSVRLKAMSGDVQLCDR
jgi:DUF4097 and DUF4098 domain-containing protein YvlB